MANLPKDGRSQEIGRLAGRALGNKLPKAWIEKELDGDSDFGIDYFIQLKSKENLVSFSFYLQLKGTTSPSYNTDMSIVSFDFKVSTLRYYLQQEPLVMVAVVDLKGREDKLWECPIYYYWLDEDWFELHKDELKTNKTISVKIPTVQKIEQKLDVYGFYSERIQKRMALNQLQKTVDNHSQDSEKSIKLITEKISEKPVILQSIEEKVDAPWLQTPEGAIATELKRCSDSLAANKLTLAKKIIDDLNCRADEFTPNERAELYYQEGSFLTLNAEYNLAESKFKLAYENDIKDRYKLGYIESRFKLDSIPSKEELSVITDELSSNTYHSCIVKAKCLALSDNVERALELLSSEYPEKLVGRMMILTIAGKHKELEQLIIENKETEFSNERDTFIYNAMSARRLFFNASNETFKQDETLPIHGKDGYDLKLMKDALDFSIKAWEAAKNLGYPGDLSVLMDISSLVYGYFNRVEELFEHFEAIVSERPNNPEIIRCYSRLLFNTDNYTRVIELVERLEELDDDDCGLLILSNYNLKKSSKTLELVKTHESLLLQSKNHNVPMIFCVAAEIANEQMDNALSSKYEDIVSGFEDGKAFLSIREFVNLSNQQPDKRQEYAEALYQTYCELEKPIVIAEQLFRYLSSYEIYSAKKVIELGHHLIQEKGLTPNGCLHLAQAFLTSENWTDAENIALINIDKGIDITNWEIIKAASLQYQGKIGAAFDAVKTAIEADNVSNEQLSYYVNLCLKLGLYKDAVNILKELISNTSDRNEKISLLQILISVYSSNSEYVEELKQAVERYGSIVDQDNCEDEGKFLLFFLMSPKHENDESKITDFQSRLAKYTKNFPDSPLLKQASIDFDSGPDAIISTLNQIAGITKEQLQKWEHNKNAIRNGSLPVPFCMLDNFLSDTRDIYTSWALSLHMPEDNIEFKFRHSPQLNQEKFSKLLSEGVSIIFEETSLLVLNELKILDKILDVIDKFSLLNSVYDKLSKSMHPLAGSIHNVIPKEIFEQINKHIQKLVLLKDSNENIFKSYGTPLNSQGFILLTDDLYMYQFLAIKNDQLISSNSLNIVEFLFKQNQLSEEEKFNLISKFCELGVFQPNMRMDVLSSTVNYYLNITDVVDYNESNFKPIFSKLFDSNRNPAHVIDLFIRMLVQASYIMELNSGTLLSLFRGLLLRHQFGNLKSFIALWFVFMNIYTKPYIESSLLFTSRKNVELWLRYKELMISVCSQNLDNREFLHEIILQLSTLSNNVLIIAYEHIKSSLIPTTEEARLFESMYQNLSIKRKLVDKKYRKKV